MTLYELKEQYQVLNKFIEDEELDRDAFKEALNQIEGSIEDKAENYIKLIKNLQSEASIFEAEAKRMKDKQEALERKAQRIKTTLDETLQELKIKKLKAGLFSIWYQGSNSVEVIDVEKIPCQYVMPVEPKIDKKAILQDIKAGQIVEGVEVKQTEGLRIR